MLLVSKFLISGSGMGVLAALILVSSIATSTLTQSVVTYPTRMVAVPGNGTATSTRSSEYFWATANSNAVSKFIQQIRAHWTAFFLSNNHQGI